METNLRRTTLDIEQRHRSQVRRAGLLESLEKALRRGFYDDEADATARAQLRKAAMDRAPSAFDDPEPDPLDVADGYVRFKTTEATS